MFLEQQIRMISEESGDTEDWRNGCWKISFASQEYKTKYIQIANCYFK